MERIKEENLNTPEYWDKYNQPTWLNADRRRGKVKYNTVIENIPSNKKVLDVGCLGGNFREYLLEKGVPIKEFYGLDFSPLSIKTARERFPDDKWLLNNCYNIELSDNSIDVVVAMEVLEHLEKPQDFLSEAFRVLVHGGLILVTVPRRNSFKDRSHVWSYSLRTLLRLMLDTTEMVGLEIKEVQSFTFSPGRRYIFCKLKIGK